MCEQQFIIDDNVIESALTGFDVSGAQENTCFMLLGLIMNNRQHRIILSGHMRRKYARIFSRLQSQRLVRNDLMASMLPLYISTRERMLDLNDRQHINARLTDCENILVILAQDVNGSVIVTQNSDLNPKVQNLHQRPLIDTPIDAIRRAQTD